MNQTIFIKLIYGKGVISFIAVMLMIGCVNDVKISQQTIKDIPPSGEIQTILRNGETRSYVIYIYCFVLILEMVALKIFSNTLGLISMY